MIARSRTHLHDAGESYRQHFRFATTFGLLAIAAGVAALVHALVPGTCTRSASRIVRHLAQLLEDRSKIDAVESDAVEARAFAMLLLLAAILIAPLWLIGAPLAIQISYTVMALALPATLMIANPEMVTRSDRAS